ncbi:hypothetical protein [uncultured Rothia sp.]|uniref:hypothetical protein n=1 Tax=uncultured Rothia sp. TaxID=316088 RepID=UPI003217A753
MATRVSIPQLIDSRFAGKAAADIEERIKTSATASETKILAEVENRLAKKVDITAFTDYTNSTPDPGTGTGSAVSVVDNGDGTLTIG